ncbi:hypothetical protein [Ruegeria halocynthiae]|uniref:hypothetical protein n=1 Tax=Ruegeria halocynthiae TaxID=985054 RepID=UPI00056B782E|nr:hypothetical protein [Ruegeria halocynthiae]
MNNRLEKAVNIGRLFQGEKPCGWSKQMLSPFDGILSVEQAEKTITIFSDLPLSEREIVREEFEKFISALTGHFFEVVSAPSNVNSADSDAFETLIDLNQSRKELIEYVDPFLQERGQVVVFDFSQKLCVLFCYDMTVLLVHDGAKLPEIALKKLKLVSIED